MTKNQYQQMLHTYVQRREENRPGVDRVRLKRRIDYCREQIKRITKREEKIRRIAMEICEYLDISIGYYGEKLPLRNSVTSTDERVIKARKLLYKYGMEQGIQGCFISEWIGAKDRYTACRGRRAFIRSFTSHPKNYQLWNEFRNYTSYQQKAA